VGIRGKVVLITGAARGLGLEYARALHAAGAKIVAGDVADCAAARAAGDRVVAVRLDVTDMASCQAMTQAAVDAFGRIDALINNAALYGSLRGGRFNAIPEGDGTPQCR
jgi:NAD(P)-dependent dehydrogenase (short-subunit alcohol dehydrogenase family)